MLAESDRASRTIDDLMELSRIEVGAERAVEPVRIVGRGPRQRRPRHRAGRAARDHDLDAVGGRGSAARATSGRQRRSAPARVGRRQPRRERRQVQRAGVEVQVRGAARRRLGRGRASATRASASRSAISTASSSASIASTAPAAASTGGTGLGLSIVRHVAGNHGGEVSVTSVEGEGSTFVLRLPDRCPTDVGARQAAGARQKESRDPTNGVRRRGRGELRRGPEIGLTREGFRVEVADRRHRGARAVRRRCKPDIVLLDVMLPRVSGIDVCRQIRAQSNVPIIMVTAKSGEIDTVVGLEVGADDYVTKPYRIRELVARIRGTAAPGAVRHHGRGRTRPAADSDAARRRRDARPRRAPRDRRGEEVSCRSRSSRCCICCWPTPAGCSPARC